MIKQDNQQEIDDFLATTLSEINKKLNKLNNEITFEPRTNMQFGSARTNIRDCTKTELFQYLAQLATVEAGITLAETWMKESNVSYGDVHKYCGYPIEDWKHDIISQLKIVEIKDKKEKLETLKKEAEAQLSEFQKRQQAVAEITNKLSTL